MANLRILCEKYITIDDKVKRLKKRMYEADSNDRTRYLADYLSAYMEREDFKSAIRRHVVNDLLDPYLVDK